MVPETAEAIHRAASAAITGGATASVGSGVAMWLRPEVWQVVGIAGGILVGLLGLIVNTAVTIFFRWRELKLAERRHEKEGLS